MDESIIKYDAGAEYFAEEQCYINEYINEGSSGISIARARVKPGVTTRFHRLKGVIERYVILEGQGSVEVGDRPPAGVVSGDVVFIPAMTKQRITNTARVDLVFLCICTPGFTPECYQGLDNHT